MERTLLIVENISYYIIRSSGADFPLKRTILVHNLGVRSIGNVVCTFITKFGDWLLVVSVVFLALVKITLGDADMCIYCYCMNL